MLSNLAGLIQHCKTAILDAWRNKVAADLCGREDFRGGPLLDALLMLEKEIRPCFAASWLGLSGMVFFLVKFVIRLFLVGSVVLLMVMVIYFGNVPFFLLLRSLKNPEFHDLMRMDKVLALMLALAWLASYAVW